MSTEERKVSGEQASITVETVTYW